MNKDTDGNQASTESSGDNRGIEAQKSNHRNATCLLLEDAQPQKE